MRYFGNVSCDVGESPSDSPLNQSSQNFDELESSGIPSEEGSHSNSLFSATKRSTSESFPKDESSNLSSDSVNVFPVCGHESPVTDNSDFIFPARTARSESRKASSQSSAVRKKVRSRSNIRFPRESPSDSVRMTQIFLEEENWFSCYVRGCNSTFLCFNDFKAHLASTHPKHKVHSFSCPLVRSCSSSYSTPRDWILHIAHSHPAFVRKQDLQYFDTFFLKK